MAAPNSTIERMAADDTDEKDGDEATPELSASKLLSWMASDEV